MRFTIYIIYSVTSFSFGPLHAKTCLGIFTIFLIDCVEVQRHVNPCRLVCVVSQKKGRKEIEEIVGEMKEREREERGIGMIVKK